MTAKVVRLRVRAKLECSACGAVGEGSCDCGAPYVSPCVRAEAAIKANPNMSDRGIAAVIGVSDKTIAKARKATAEKSAVGKRTGRDGKARRLPRRPEPTITDPVKEINEFQRELIGFLDDFTARFRKWHQSGPLVDKDGKAALMQAMYLLADGFAHLAQEFDGR